MGSSELDLKFLNNMSDDEHAVLTLRNLIFDICNQNGGGHGGSAIGMAAIGVALWKHVMRYNPSNPDWFDRDRFVLSNGMHTRNLNACRDLMLTKSQRSLCNVSIRAELFDWV